MNGFSSCNNQPAADWELRTCNILRVVEWSLQVLRSVVSEWVAGLVSRTKLRTKSSLNAREQIHCTQAVYPQTLMSRAQCNTIWVCSSRFSRECANSQGSTVLPSSPLSLLHFTTWIPPLLDQQSSHTGDFHQWALTTARVYSITSQSIYSLWSTVQARPP